MRKEDSLSFLVMLGIYLLQRRVITVRKIPSSFNLRFLLVTSMEISTGISLAKEESFTILAGNLMPIAEALDLESSDASLASPSRSSVVEYST